MSRHKLIRNLDLDDELDDYSGGVDYDDDLGKEEELSAEDQRMICIGYFMEY